MLNFTGVHCILTKSSESSFMKNWRFSWKYYQPASRSCMIVVAFAITVCCSKLSSTKWSACKYLDVWTWSWLALCDCVGQPDRGINRVSRQQHGTYENTMFRSFGISLSVSRLIGRNSKSATQDRLMEGRRPFIISGEIAEFIPEQPSSLAYTILLRYRGVCCSICRSDFAQQCDWKRIHHFPHRDQDERRCRQRRALAARTPAAICLVLASMFLLIIQ